MNVVIDEQGNPQTWTAVYWRHCSLLQEACDSVDVAVRFLAAGEEEGALSALEVRGPDGKVVITEEEIFDACYGYGRWAEDSRAQTLREIAGGAE